MQFGIGEKMSEAHSLLRYENMCGWFASANAIIVERVTPDPAKSRIAVITNPPVLFPTIH